MSILAYVLCYWMCPWSVISTASTWLRQLYKILITNYCFSLTSCIKYRTCTIKIRSNLPTVSLSHYRIHTGNWKAKHIPYKFFLFCFSNGKKRFLKEAAKVTLRGGRQHHSNGVQSLPSDSSADGSGSMQMVWIPSLTWGVPWSLPVEERGVW